VDQIKNQAAFLARHKSASLEIDFVRQQVPGAKHGGAGLNTKRAHNTLVYQCVSLKNCGERVCIPPKLLRAGHYTQE
jgi:hypothetical protein